MLANKVQQTFAFKHFFRQNSTYLFFTPEKDTPQDNVIMHYSVLLCKAKKEDIFFQIACLPWYVPVLSQWGEIFSEGAMLILCSRDPCFHENFIDFNPL